MRDFLAFENLENVELDEEMDIQSEKKALNWSSIGEKSEEHFDIEDLKLFLEWPEYSFWNGFIHLETNSKLVFN